MAVSRKNINSYPKFSFFYRFINLRSNKLKKYLTETAKILQLLFRQGSVFHPLLIDFEGTFACFCYFSGRQRWRWIVLLLFSNSVKNWLIPTQREDRYETGDGMVVFLDQEVTESNLLSITMFEQARILIIVFLQSYINRTIYVSSKKLDRFFMISLFIFLLLFFIRLWY